VFNKTGQQTERIRESLERPVRTIDVLHAIPRSSAQGVKVHGDAAQSYPDSYWTSTRGYMSYAVPEAVDVAERRRDGESIAAAFSRSVRESTSKKTDLVVVVGEIHQGNIWFGDGSNLRVAALTSDAPNLVVVGCNSANHIEPTAGSIVLGIGARLDWEQAIQLSSFLSQSVKSRIARTGEASVPAFTLRDLLLLMQNSAWTQRSPPTGLVVPVSVFVPIDGRDHVAWHLASPPERGAWT
jgi:hypothetical protein